jgi:hypothetical protein
LTGHEDTQLLLLRYKEVFKHEVQCKADPRQFRQGALQLLQIDVLGSTKVAFGQLAMQLKLELLASR